MNGLSFRSFPPGPPPSPPPVTLPGRPMTAAARRRMAQGVALALTLAVCASTAVLVPTTPPGAEAAQVPVPSLTGLPADVEGLPTAVDVAPLLARGVLNRFPDGLFRPQLEVTRVQLAQMLVLALGAGADATAWAQGPSPFPDLAAGHWGRGFAAAARELGVVRGYPDSSFQPDRPVARAEAAVMLARALEAGVPPAPVGTEGGAAFGGAASPAGSAGGLPFADAGSIPPWARDAVRAVCVRGLWPCPAGAEFSPERPVTRAEAAGAVRRLMEARALLWDLAGEVVRVEGQTLELGTAGGPVTLSVVEGAWVARNGAHSSLEGLSLLDQAAVMVGPAGVVCLEAYLDAELARLAAVEPDGGGLWLEPVEPGALGPAGTLPRRVAPDCPVYRGGRPSTLGGLAPQDRLFLIYDHWTGDARLVDAVRVDCSGRVQAAPESGGPLPLYLDGGGRRSFEPAPGVLVFVDGAPAGWERLQAGDRVTALTVEAGQVVYLEALRAAEASRGAFAAAAGRGGVEEAAGRGGVEEAAAARLSAQAGSGVWSAADPGRPLQVNQAAMGVPALQRLVGASGRGTLIAVVDTGVEAGTPELTLTSDGRPKLVDWVDFTGEGRVDTGLLTRLEGGRLYTSLGVVTARTVESASGLVHYGVLRETQLAPQGRLSQDLDQDGSSQGSFLVVAADSTVPASYDTVYVDSDGDRDLDDETPLGLFRDTGAMGWFGPAQEAPRPQEIPRPGCAFVVAGLELDGSQVELGFDGNGHGTHLAGVAAGWGAGEGSVTGVAPGAQIMALKALDSSGRGDWGDIARALRYAAEHGADVVALSVSGTGQGDQGWETEDRLMRELGAACGTLFVVAAGNSGPGLGSASVPGDPDFSLAVGAYLSPEMWEYSYGYRVPRPELWYWSAVGPGPGGRAVPDLVAPGVAVSCVPPWADAGGYELFEGTSVAVPHVAGAACLLLEASRRAGLRVDGLALGRALRGGARPLEGYLAVEQGWGAVDVEGAWTALRSAAAEGAVDPAAAWAVDWPGAGAASGGGSSGPVASGGGSSGGAGPAVGPGGLCARGSLPGQARLTVEAGRVGELELVGDPQAPWLVPDRARVGVWPQASRALEVSLLDPGEPGLQGASLGVKWRGSPGAGGAAPAGEGHCLQAAVAVPLPQPADPLAPVTAWGRLGPAQYRRFYVRVPEAASALGLRLEAAPASPDQGGGRRSGPWGRVRLHAFDPQGREALLTPFVGLPAADGAEAAAYTLARPQAGVWELVVYSSAALSDYGLGESEFHLEARVERLAWVAPPEVALASDHEGDWSARVTVKNLGQPAVLEALLTPLAARPLGWSTQRLPLEPDGTATGSLGEVPSNCRLLEVGVSNPSDGETDLDLYLYRLDPATGGWTETASSARAGVLAETVEVRDPVPGQYVAYVQAPEGAPESTSLQLDWLVVPWAGGGRVAQGPARVSAGQEWTLDLQAPAPLARGRYYASLVVREANRKEVVAILPLRVHRGLPELVVDVWPQALSPGFVPVAVAVRERLGGRPVDLELEMNGRRYWARNGRALLYVESSPSGADLAVVVDDQRYQPLARTFRLGPADLAAGGPQRPVAQPLWLDPGTPLSVLVNKALAQE